MAEQMLPACAELTHLNEARADGKHDAGSDQKVQQQAVPHDVADSAYPVCQYFHCHFTYPFFVLRQTKSRTQSASGYGSKETERQQTDGTSCTVRKHLLWFRGTYFYILTSIKTGSSLSFCLRDWHANPFCARCTFGSPLEERSPEPHPLTVLIRVHRTPESFAPSASLVDFFLLASFVALWFYGIKFNISLHECQVFLPVGLHKLTSHEKR